MPSQGAAVVETRAGRYELTKNDSVSATLTIEAGAEKFAAKRVE